MAWKTNWSVSVGGQVITAALSPYLETITVTDKAGASSDSCRLTLDDTGGRIKLPQPGQTLVVWLNGVQVFTGVIDSVKSSGSRSAGRGLSVSAKGFDVRGKAKEPQRFHKDDGTIGDFLKTASQNAGFELKIDDDLANIARDYIAADGESLLHIGEKIARELGATFKLREPLAVLAKHGGDFGLPEIAGLFTADDSGNLISWDIEPISTRPVFKEIEARYFDRNKGEVLSLKEDGGEAGKRAEAVNVVRYVAHDENHAREIVAGRKRENEREGGKGRVELDLTPTAQAEALFRLSGTRTGVDGTYRIVSVTHKASRSSGATTSLELQQPQDGAGTDDR
ncbi:phage late control D family protein [Roseibium album]|uniref:phage late control D family protein n=1 Tax=Roseibium album TaxID=311410 RepID=UPI00248F6CFD|nr:late control D family protein [Roseibium album]